MNKNNINNSNNCQDKYNGHRINIAMTPAFSRH